MTPSSFFLSMVSPFLFKHVEGNLSQNQKQEPVKEGTGTNGSQGARYEAQLHQQGPIYPKDGAAHQKGRQ